MDQFKHIMIVTSCINVDSSPLAYWPTRSYFTPEERVEQTVKTIQKIRKHFPSYTYIILANTNHLTNSQYELFKSLCDDVFIFDKIILDNIEITADIVKTHPSKSFAETASLYHACQKILEKNIPFDYVLKTSGRYWFLDHFDLNKWPVRTNVIVSPMSDDGVVNNLLYTVPKSMFQYYIDRLKHCCLTCYYDNRNNKHGVENTLFDYKNKNVHEFLNYAPLGIGGYCLVKNRTWWEC